jgi:hypothetical protein
MDTGEVERVEDQKFLAQLGGAHTKKKTKIVSPSSRRRVVRLGLDLSLFGYSYSNVLYFLNL